MGGSWWRPVPIRQHPAGRTGLRYVHHAFIYPARCPGTRGRRSVFRRTLGDDPRTRYRDIAHGEEKPLYLRNLSVIYYLTDVDASTHCFSIFPESVEAKQSAPDHRDGSCAGDLHGPAGTAILSNAANVHDARQRTTDRQRRTIHIYYGRRSTPPLSVHTVFPRRLVEAKDPGIRKLFSRPNEITQRIRRGWAEPE